MPAREAQTPTSQSAAVSASRSRAAYGAPDAPVIPRKTCTRRLLRTLRGGQEDPDVADVLRAPEVAELRHDLVPELARVRDVAREELRVGIRLADGAEVG